MPAAVLPATDTAEMLIPSWLKLSGFSECAPKTGVVIVCSWSVGPGSGSGVAVPVISHETGQWCAYPDFGVIGKFSGKGDYVAFPKGVVWGDEAYMIPGNYEIMRDSAAANGLLQRNKALAHGSGRFQVAC